MDKGKIDYAKKRPIIIWGRKPEKSRLQVCICEKYFSIIEIVLLLKLQGYIRSYIET
jgi:hypothetical protein